MLAKKENRVYRITELEKETYLKRGFDIVDEKGKIITASPDKKVSYNKYLEVVKKLEKAEEGSKNSKDKDLKDEIKALKEEIKALKAEIKTSESEITKLVGENTSLKKEIETLKGDNDGKVQK